MVAFCQRITATRLSEEGNQLTLSLVLHSYGLFVSQLHLARTLLEVEQMHN